MELNLRETELITLELAAIPCKLACHSGKLWVTVTGDNRDYLLQAGASHSFPKGGNLVIEAWEDSTVLVMHPAASAPRARPLRLAMATT